MEFTNDLTDRLIAYMRQRGISITASQAEDFLISLAGLYEAMGQMREGSGGAAARASAPRLDGPDLITPHNY